MSRGCVITQFLSRNFQSCHPATLVFDPATKVCNWATAPGMAERCEAAKAEEAAEAAEADNEIPALELGHGNVKLFLN